MAGYVDGFVLVVPKKNVEAYRRMARAAGRIWREHGALEFRECMSDDLTAQHGLPFAKLLKLKRGEAVFFSWIVFKSRKHRDGVNKKVMADERLKAMMKERKMPFDTGRMSYGGFKVVVEA